MRIGELKSGRERALGILKQEEEMRRKVFATRPSALRVKLAEIDFLRTFLNSLANQAAPHCEPDVVQADLFGEVDRAD